MKRIRNLIKRLEIEIKGNLNLERDFIIRAKECDAVGHISPFSTGSGSINEGVKFMRCRYCGRAYEEPYSAKEWDKIMKKMKTPVGLSY